MKNLIFIALLLMTTKSMALETVSSLDVQRYLGLWHQIATIPQSFSQNCVRNTTSQYALTENDLIKVTNSCEEQNGNISEAIGRARVNQNYNTNSKLEVTFVKFMDWVWSFSGDYWVIALDEQDYQWSVVGHPDLDYLWILSRSTTMDNARLLELRTFIESVGYDSCQILMSANTDNSYNGNERLCDLQL